MSDETGGTNIAEAQRLWEEYQRKYGAGTPTGADTAVQGSSALQRAFEAIGRPAGAVVGGAMHVLGAPARAVNAIGTNLAGTQAPIPVGQYALLGQNLENQSRPVGYGDVLAGTMEESGEITPGGRAAAIIRAAGNLITDPAAAPLLLGGAEAAGALAGRFGPSAGAAGPQMPRAPRSRLAPSSRPMPRGPRQGPPPEPGPVPLRPTDTQPVQVFDPTATQPVQTLGPSGPKPRLGGPRAKPKLEDPNATQPVKTVRPEDRTQPVKTIKPKRKPKPKPKEPKED